MDKQDFQFLLDKYLNRRASAEEEQLLLDLFESFQTDAGWDEGLLGVKQQLEDKMLQRVQLAIKQSAQKPQSSIFHFTAFRNIAAAVLVLITLSISIYYGFKQPDKKLSVVKNTDTIINDVDPGKNTATLTLDNGDKLVLNAAKIGTLAKKGKININKTKDGEVIYEFDEKSKSSNNQRLAFNTITTPRGGQYQVVLSDGTRVWLNAASSLKFPTSFTGRQRNVVLTGEAYFEVAKNAAKPFIVKANNVDVMVLGTHFNIMAYNDEDAIKTTLLEGSVQLSSGSAVSLLKPDQQGIATGNGIKVIDVDAERAIAWKNGFFEFNRSSIQDIMKQLSRWYNIEVVYRGNATNDEFVGKIERSVKLSQVLHILELSQVHFKIEDKRIIVLP